MHIREYMCNAAIVVVVAQIPSNNGALGKGPEAEMRVSPVSKPKKGVDRLWKEGELLFQILQRKRERTRQKTL